MKPPPAPPAQLGPMLVPGVGLRLFRRRAFCGRLRNPIQMEQPGPETGIELQPVSAEVARPNPGGIPGGHHNGQGFGTRSEDLDHAQSRVLEVGRSISEVGGRYSGVIGLENAEDFQAPAMGRSHGGFQRLPDRRQREGTVLRPRSAKHVGPGAVPVQLQVSQVLPIHPGDPHAASFPHHQFQGARRVESPAPVTEKIHRHGELEGRLSVDANRRHGVPDVRRCGPPGFPRRRRKGIGWRS